MSLDGLSEWMQLDGPTANLGSKTWYILLFKFGLAEHKPILRETCLKGMGGQMCLSKQNMIFLPHMVYK